MTTPSLCRLILLFLLHVSVCYGSLVHPALSWQPDSLIMASGDATFFYEFDVSNKQRDVVQYRALPHGYESCKAITYDSLTKTLFWSGRIRDNSSGEWTDHILSTVNNSGVVNTVYSGQDSIRGMAVDSRRNYLFISDLTDDKIAVMDTRGDNYEILSYVYDDCNMSPFHLALDTNRQLIYVACYYHLLSMSYNGYQKKELHSGSRIWNVVLNQPTGTLIFNDNKYVYTLNPYNENSAMYIQLYLDHPPVSVINHGPYLFITYLEHNDIDIADIRRGSIITTIRNVPGDNYHWRSLAYIPPE